MRGTRLREIRERRRLTQEELAELLQVHATAVYRWETGRSAPQQEQLVTLAQVLNVSTDYLLGLSDDDDMHVRSSELSDHEQRVINAMRQGDTVGAIREIVG